MKDYAVGVTVRNNYLLQHMERRGYYSAAELSRASGVYPSDIGKCLNLRISGLNKRGQWRPYVLRISECLGVLPDMLFPPQHLSSALATNKASFEFDHAEYQAFVESRRCDDPDGHYLTVERSEKVSEILGKLPPRMAEVIRMRFGMGDYEPHTLVEAGEKLGVSGNRVNQIEHKALRLLGRRPELADYIAA